MAAARPDTWMPIYWGDYLKDTGHLSTIEHGAYLLLIGHYWSSGAPLPDDDAKLRRIAKVETAAQWKKLRPTLAALFQIGGGLWRHGRIDRELASAAKRSADARSKAERAARARWMPDHDAIPEAGGEQPNDDAPSNATGMLQAMPGAMLEDCPSQPQSSSQSPEPDEEAAAASFAAARGRTAIPPDAPMRERRDQDQAMRLWNEFADANGLDRIDMLTSERRGRLSRIFALGGLEAWRNALAKAPSQQYLRLGEGWQGWFGFDFLLDETKFVKLLEGRYAERNDRRSAMPTKSDLPPEEPWEKRVRDFRKDGFWNATTWGPKPGEPGCRAPANLVRSAA